MIFASFLFLPFFLLILGSDLSEDSIIYLSASDGVICNMTYRYIPKLKTVDDLMEVLGGVSDRSNPIPLPRVSSDDFEAVKKYALLDYASEYDDARDENECKEYLSGLDIKSLSRLFNAANFLFYEKLIKECPAEMARRVENKSVEEMRSELYVKKEQCLDEKISLRYETDRAFEVNRMEKYEKVRIRRCSQ